MEIKIDKQQAGKRLDLVLALFVPKYSRSSIRKILDQGGVTWRGGMPEYRPNYKVRVGDVFEIDTKFETQKKRLPPYKYDLNVIYEDNNLLVVNKPEGLNVHPVSSKDNKSVLNAAVYYLGDSITEYGVTLINRIDKGTSGVLLLAKNSLGAWYYSKQFAENNVRKTYLALVKGNWTAKHGKEFVKVANFLQDDHLNSRRTVNNEEGEFAEVHIRGLAYVADRKVSLLELRPTTGRKHQLRVQLANVGFPIIGDERYQGPEGERLFLHAWKLDIAKYVEQDEDSQNLSLYAEVPQLFKSYANEFKTVLENN